MNQRFFANSGTINAPVNTGDAGGDITVTQTNQVSSDKVLTDDIIEQIKKLISEQCDLSESMKNVAYAMTDQLKEEQEPSKRQQVFAGLKGLVGPVVAGLLVELVKGVAGFSS